MLVNRVDCNKLFFVATAATSTIEAVGAELTLGQTNSLNQSFEFVETQ